MLYSGKLNIQDVNYYSGLYLYAGETSLHWKQTFMCLFIFCFYLFASGQNAARAPLRTVLKNLAPGIKQHNGDLTKKWLTHFFYWTALSFVLAPQMIYSENYRVMALLLVIVQLVMVDNFGVLAVITSISCHVNDLKSYETTNIAHIAIFVSLYGIHYYLFYIGLYRGFDRALI